MHELDTRTLCNEMLHWLIMSPPEEPLLGQPFFMYERASWHIVNVPTESISITVENK